MVYLGAVFTHTHTHTHHLILYTDTHAALHPRHATHLFPLSYYADGYWDGPGQQPSDAAVRVNFAANVSIEACNFLESLGGYGVGVGNKTVNSSVRGCLFDRVGQGGVFLYGFDYDATTRANGEVPGNNTKPQWVEVSHNVISDMGQMNLGTVTRGEMLYEELLANSR